jgi:general stress protein 26
VTYANDEVGQMLGRFMEIQFVALATMDGLQPRVRPMTLIYLDRRFWFVTSAFSDKVKQIKQNANVESTYQFTDSSEDCCIRLLGRAEIIQDKRTKTDIAKRIGFFNDHWSGSEDPDYTLLEILPPELQRVSPSGMRQFRL